MTKVTAQMSVSLDGFYTGPRDTRGPKDMSGWMRGPEAPGFFRVTRWVVDAMAWRERQGFAGGEQSINSEIIDAYIRLHHADKAHSVEAYAGGELAGGLYGVTLGGAFMGESMFTRMRDASKVCLVYLVNRLQERGYELLDCQIQNPHLAKLGAREIPEQEYLRRLQHALTLECSFA